MPEAPDPRGEVTLVFVVVDDHETGGSEIIEVFESKEEAQALCEQRGEIFGSCHVEQWLVRKKPK